LITKEFGIPLNTYNKKNILCKLATFSKKDRKRAREPENPDIVECVYKWFKQNRHMTTKFH
jgi:hypothetical protein